MFYAILLPGKDFLQDEKWKSLLKLTSQLHSSKKKKGNTMHRLGVYICNTHNWQRVAIKNM